MATESSLFAPIRITLDIHQFVGMQIHTAGTGGHLNVEARPSEVDIGADEDMSNGLDAGVGFRRETTLRSCCSTHSTGEASKRQNGGKHVG
jgi:hypothetical protein